MKQVSKFKNVNIFDISFKNKLFNFLFNLYLLCFTSSALALDIEHKCDLNKEVLKIEFDDSRFNQGSKIENKYIINYQLYLQSNKSRIIEKQDAEYFEYSVDMKLRIISLKLCDKFLKLSNSKYIKTDQYKELNEFANFNIDNLDSLFSELRGITHLFTSGSITVFEYFEKRYLICKQIKKLNIHYQCFQLNLLP